MKPLKIIALIGCLPLIVGCPEPHPHYDPFSIRVVDESGTPLQGVSVYSVGDGSYWNPGYLTRRYTNSTGWVELDGYGKDKEGSIRQTDYLPVDVVLKADSTYVLRGMPYLSKTLAVLEGEMFGFHRGYIISLTPNGFYRCYTYDQTGVSAPVSMQLEIEDRLGSFQVYGDQLWLTNNGKRINRYDISDPLNPVYQDFIKLPNRGDIEAIDGNVWLLSGISYDRIHVYEELNDSLIYRSAFPTEGFAQIYLKNRRLLLNNSDGWWGYDISDLEHPQLINPNRTYDDMYALFLDTLMLRRTSSDNQYDSSYYQIYTLTDPCYPQPLQSIVVPGRLSRLTDLDRGYIAFTYSHYLVDDGSLFVSRRPGTSRFEFVGYALSENSAAVDSFCIGSDSLRMWTARP